MRARRTAIVLVVVLIVYLVIAVAYGVAFIQSGSLIGTGLGIGVLILPLIALWIVWREMRFGAGVARMAHQLDVEGGLPVDDLPRTAGGRVDRDAADAAFDDARQQTEADPQDWRSWFRVAAAYDAAGDRRRARAAMRHALGLYQAGDTPNH